MTPSRAASLAQGELEGGASECPGCRLALPVRVGPTPGSLGCSPACWQLYGEVLAREYSDPDYFRVHQLTVDAYAVQHPGGHERRAIQSVALHLTTLYLVLECGADPREGPRVHKRLAKRVSFHWLEPPDPIGRITVAEVFDARTRDEHERMVEAWARDVWAAWEPHHATVEAWIERLLPERLPRRST